MSARNHLRRPHPLHRLLGCALLALATSCQGTRLLMDPTLRIDTEGGTELGVATEYGVVFLGRTATAGEVDVTAWFGDGPSVEPSVVEPVGGSLYTAETEIRLPWVQLTFEPPAVGSSVRIIGRNADGSLWQEDVSVRSHSRVRGILLDVPGRLRREAADQTGAGVFVMSEDEDPRKLKLLGLISGRVRLPMRDGSMRDYLAVVGPVTLSNLVTYHRQDVHRRRWVYRDDIL